MPAGSVRLVPTLQGQPLKSPRPLSSPPKRRTQAPEPSLHGVRHTWDRTPTAIDPTRLIAGQEGWVRAAVACKTVGSCVQPTVKPRQRTRPNRDAPPQPSPAVRMRLRLRTSANL